MSYSCERQCHFLTSLGGKDPLAYYTAKTNGLDAMAEEIMEMAGMTDEDLPPVPSAVASSSKPLGPAPVITSQSELNWPQLGQSESYFDRALADGSDAVDEGGYANGYTNGEVKEDAWADEVDINGDAAEGEEVDEDEGWDLDAEVIDPVHEYVEEQAGVEEGELPSDVSPGVNEDEQWTRNSPLAADHAAAGAFETAMQASLEILRLDALYVCSSEYFLLQLLNRQVAAVNFAPLKPHFLAAYQSAHVHVSANPSLPAIRYNVRRNPETSELREVLPMAVYTLDDVTSTDLPEAYRLFGRGKFAEALVQFRTIMQKLLMVVVKTDSEAKEVSTAVIFCVNVQLLSKGCQLHFTGR